MGNLSGLGLKDVTEELVKLDWYPVIIIDADLKPTKDGTGKRIAVTFQIVQSGPYMNKQIFGGYNVVNKSAEAQKIGQRQFSDLCKACGLQQETLEGTAPLKNKKLLLRVGPNKDETQNDVKGHKVFVAPTATRQPNLVEQAFEDTPKKPTNPFA